MVKLYEQPLSISKLIRKTNITSRKYRIIIDKMLLDDLITFDNDKYYITSKGIYTLKILNSLKDIMEDKNEM
jgi:predicted transcriptional regulator